MQTRGGSESFRDAPPTQEEMGLRFSDLKPPSWCLVQVPKMAAHLAGGGIEEKKLQEKHVLESKRGRRGDNGAL